jgi:hypothetical protein
MNLGAAGGGLRNDVKMPIRHPSRKAPVIRLDPAPLLRNFAPVHRDAPATPDRCAIPVRSTEPLCALIRAWRIIVPEGKIESQVRPDAC